MLADIQNQLCYDKRTHTYNSNLLTIKSISQKRKCNCIIFALFMLMNFDYFAEFGVRIALFNNRGGKIG